MEYPKLNFPPIHLRARRNGSGKTEVFDRVRRRWLVLTPEEWVRRHAVEYLIAACGYLPEQIVEEYPVNINGMAQRADIVVMGRNAKPEVVVECKETNVKLTIEVVNQVVRYNSVLQCRYVVITNGIDCYCYRHENNSYTPIANFPKAE